jgi:hypothetical protein
MTETAHPRTPIDTVTIAREIRGSLQGISYKLMTGEEPSITYGWQRSTCLDQYGGLDPVGKAAVRLMPTGFGLWVAGLALQARPRLALETPALLAVILLGYLVAHWALVTFYDPLVGLVELAAELGVVRW